MTGGAQRITAERQRQISVEGWSPELDDMLDGYQLLRAAACYIETVGLMAKHKTETLPPCFVHKNWPFPPGRFKHTKGKIALLTKAGALIAAEIDRLERREAKNS